MLDVAALSRQVSALEIEKMLVLSTGHLTESTADILNDAAHDEPPFCELEWGPSFARDEGWLFRVRPLAENGAPDESEGTPLDLSRVFMFAREHGCAWVMFDCDGPQIEELPWAAW